MTIPLAASDLGGEAAPGPLRRVAVTGATGNVGTSLVPPSPNGPAWLISEPSHHRQRGAP